MNGETGVTPRVWSRMKEHAHAFAERKRLLSLRDARMFVLQICRDERVKRPAPEALEYLASALVRLTLEASETVSAPERSVAAGS